MSRRLLPHVVLSLLLLALVAPAAEAGFGVDELDVTFTNADGTPATQAGSHPFAMTTKLAFATRVDPEYGEVVDEAAKDLRVSQVEGLAGTPLATPRCSNADFADIGGNGYNACPNSTAVGMLELKGGFDKLEYFNSPVYSIEAPPGAPAKFGFIVAVVPVTFEVVLDDTSPYSLLARVTHISQSLQVAGTELTLWGNPASPAHDPLRGSCLSLNAPTQGQYISQGNCPASGAEVPLLTLPRACGSPLATRYAADSWQTPGAWFADGHPDLSDPAWVSGETLTEGPFSGCSKLGFTPSIDAKPTSKAATSPSGLDFDLSLEDRVDRTDRGLMEPEGIANSDLRKAVVTLPQGFSVNPSIAAGLEVCSEADLERESAFSEPGAGCPQAAKIGSVEVETPLLDEKVNGALFQADPYDNPFHSLIALYVVLQNPTLGIRVVQPLKVETDPLTGQLTTVSEELPQLPFSHFRLHFHEGARSPLVTPPGCGSYDAEAKLTPWSGGAPVTTTSTFQIISGPDNGPCPSGGLPPFHPGLTAGTLNNAAGRFSPFNVRLSRNDSEQEITHFSIKLPPGITGKLAGIPFCSDAAIAAATARTGPHGGQEELNSPSCPAASEIGHTLVGSGVGPTRANAPGKHYQAGPYHGSPISLVAITAGVVGPFDIGTVVVREAFKIDPETAEVFIDATGSDPIPHIIKGIPVHLRDIRAYTDRPEFVLNPTSCKRTSTASTLLGAGLDFGSEADDRPVTVSTPFQAADCAALPFKPKLSLKLIGGTKRGAHPALKAFLRMSGFGEAGIASAQVTLPKSEFIENAHFNTICTRVQFKEAGGNGEACPAGSIYGFAKAKSPILAEPLEGPVFLRSSEHQLPDLVASLRGREINVHLVGHVDSVKGRLRNTFETVPDAPVEWASFSFHGQKKGLFVNSTDLCKATHKAKVDFTGHNGKAYDYGTPLKVKCPKGKAKKKQHS